MKIHPVLLQLRLKRRRWMHGPFMLAMWDFNNPFIAHFDSNASKLYSKQSSILMLYIFSPFIWHIYIEYLLYQDISIWMVTDWIFPFGGATKLKEGSFHWEYNSVNIVSIDTNILDWFRKWSLSVICFFTWYIIF